MLGRTDGCEKYIRRFVSTGVFSDTAREVRQSSAACAGAVRYHKPVPAYGGPIMIGAVIVWSRFSFRCRCLVRTRQRVAKRNARELADSPFDDHHVARRSIKRGQWLPG